MNLVKTFTGIILTGTMVSVVTGCSATEEVGITPSPSTISEEPEVIDIAEVEIPELSDDTVAAQLSGSLNNVSISYAPEVPYTSIEIIVPSDISNKTFNVEVPNDYLQHTDESAAEFVPESQTAIGVWERNDGLTSNLIMGSFVEPVTDLTNDEYIQSVLADSSFDPSIEENALQAREVITFPALGDDLQAVVVQGNDATGVVLTSCMFMYDDLIYTFVNFDYVIDDASLNDFTHFLDTMTDVQ